VNLVCLQSLQGELEMLSNIGGRVGYVIAGKHGMVGRLGVELRFCVCVSAYKNSLLGRHRGSDAPIVKALACQFTLPRYSSAVPEAYTLETSSAEI